MRTLRASDVPAYLRERGLGPARAEELSGGVSNIVFRVTPAEGPPFVLKQSQPQLRTKDAWFSDVRRVFRECAVMRALADALPEEAQPRVLWEDRENYLFAMSHAPAGASPWKEQLLAGDVDPARARQAGAILGRIHEASASDLGRFAPFDDATVFEELRTEPFYLRVQPRCPDVAGPLQELIDDLRTRKTALCHGDFTPKNLLAHATGLCLVDYETATLGEPAMDLGLFLAHLFLKAIRRPDQTPAYANAVRGFWSAYAAEVRSLAMEDHERRGVRHLGACMLARVDGASPVDYLDGPARERVRRLSRTLLFGRATNTEAALGLLDDGPRAES